MMIFFSPIPFIYGIQEFSSKSIVLQKKFGNWAQEDKVSLPSPDIVPERNIMKIQKGHADYQEIISSKTKWKKIALYLHSLDLAFSKALGHRFDVGLVWWHSSNFSRGFFSGVFCCFFFFSLVDTIPNNFRTVIGQRGIPNRRKLLISIACPVVLHEDMWEIWSKTAGMLQNYKLWRETIRSWKLLWADLCLE